MKYVKMLSLAVVAATALMAFVGAGTASAEGGVLCSTTANPCPTAQKWTTPETLHLTLEESLKQQTTGGFITAATCSTATIKSTLTANPAADGKAKITNELITFGAGITPCTKAETTLAAGKLRVERIAGSSNGTVIVDEEVKETTQGLFSGENCVYGFAAGTSIGTLTEGKPATFDLKGVATKFSEADSCPSGPATTEWSGKFQLTEPSGTTLSVSSS